MRKSKKSHSIDFLFLMVVFLLFTFSAISVLLMAINSYKGIVDNSEKDSTARAAVAYVREVVHQNDISDAIKLVTYKGKQVLSVDQGQDYVLYIYEQDGMLKELYTKVGSGVELSEGVDILPVNSFDMSLEKSILFIDCTDSFNNRETVVISIKSKG